MKFLILIPFLLALSFGCRSEASTGNTAAGNDQPEITASPTPPIANKEKTDNPDSPASPGIIAGGKFCEKYLLSKIAADKDEASTLSELKFNPKDKNLPAAAKTWLDSAVQATLAANRLQGKGKNFLLLHAENTAATGLAANLEYWLIQFDRKAIEFQSFSENPQLIWLDKAGALNYYSVVYSDEFIENKDWDNPTYKIEKYHVNPVGEKVLVSTENYLKCE